MGLLYVISLYDPVMMPTAPLELRYKLILGSGSPRRQELLQRVGLPYDLRVVPVDETVDPSWKTDQVAEHLALQKPGPSPSMIMNCC